MEEKLTREEMIADLMADKGVRKMVHLNMFSIGDLVDEFDKQRNVLATFKESLIDPRILDNLMTTDVYPGTTEQGIHFMLSVLKSIPILEKFDKAVTEYLPVIALVCVMLKKKGELEELHKATEV